MARRIMTPVRRRRRVVRAAIALPILLAALALALDFPFLTARGALAATQARYGFGPGTVIAQFSPQDEHMPPLRYYIVRDGDWFAWCCVERDELFWRSGALTAARPDAEAPLAILPSPYSSNQLVVVSHDPDIVEVELDYLSKSYSVDSTVYFHVETALQTPLDGPCFLFSPEDAYSILFYSTPSAAFRVRGYGQDGKLLYESPAPHLWTYCDFVPTK